MGLAGTLGYGAGGGGGGATAPLTLASGTIASNAPALTLTQTWNNGSEVFSAFVVDVAISAAATTSRLMDLRIGGSSYFAVQRGDGYGPTLSTSGSNGIRFGSKLTIVSAKETNIPGGSMSAGYNGLHFEGISGDVTIGFRGNWGYDKVVGALRIVGCAQYASPTTNLIGGHVFVTGGQGASGSSGAAHGGSLYLDGGQGYGTGDHGDVVVGATRGKLDVRGVLKFGTHSAIGAETVTGFVEIEDAGGTTRKLAVVS